MLQISLSYMEDRLLELPRNISYQDCFYFLSISFALNPSSETQCDECEAAVLMCVSISRSVTVTAEPLTSGNSNFQYSIFSLTTEDPSNKVCYIHNDSHFLIFAIILAILLFRSAILVHIDII
jgi:hypothetical protein